MNQPTDDFLTVAESAQISTDLDSLMTDPQIRLDIVYRTYTGRTFTPSTGAMTPSYTDTQFGVVKEELSAREVQAGAGLYRVGDARFLVRRASHSATPNREDRLAITATIPVPDGTETYEIVNWGSDPIGKLWHIIGRRVV